MKNVKHHKEDSFIFHTSVVNSKYKSKDDPDYKDRVRGLDERVREQYVTYDELFAANSLEQMAIFPYSTIEKNDLLKLYSYKCAVVKSLKQKLTTSETGRILNTCPNCTISEISSFDHYLPKNEYPGFVVNPKNLFPSCTICNGHKSETWRVDGKRQFLNLYLDELPQEQYLFVTPSFSNGVIIAKYNLKRPDTISQKLFDIIQSHYDKLHLLSRFANNIHELVTSMESSIITYGQNISTEQLSALIIEKYNRDRIVFGHNYWKAILAIELAKNHRYMNHLLGRE
jgi:5-methylcytosine-specific restriction endonuclease McrA